MRTAGPAPIPAAKVRNYPDPADAGSCAERFFIKKSSRCGARPFRPGPDRPGGVCRREGYGLCRFGCFAPFVSGAACRFSRPSSGGGTGSTVRTVRGEAPIRSFRSWPAEPPLCDRSLAVKKRTVLRTVAGRIKKVVPSWEIRINLCNFVIRGVVSFREGGSGGSFCFT